MFLSLVFDFLAVVLLLLCSCRLALRLDRFDPSNRTAVLHDFAGRVQTLRLRLESQAKKRLGSLFRGGFQLLVAHLAKFSDVAHGNS